MSIDTSPRDTLHARVVGPALLRKSMEKLLSEVPGIALTDSAPYIPIVLPFGPDHSLTAICSEGSCLDAPSVVLVIPPEPVEIVRAHEAGIRTIVGIDEPVSTLLAALNATASSKAYCSPQIVASLMGVHTREADPAARTRSRAPSPLTDQEREVAVLVVRGLTDAMISRELFISVATVKYHLHKVLRKLGASRRAEVAFRILGSSMESKR